MAAGPRRYQTGEGGGSNPPYGEDFFQRIVGVHWPRRLPALGLTNFATGDYGGYTQYASASQAAAARGSVSFSETSQAFAPPFYPFAGFAYGSSFRNIGGQSVFVMVGGDGGRNEPGSGKDGSHGVIIASSDGRNWFTVFEKTPEHQFNEHGEMLPNSAVFLGVVWDESAGAFFASLNMSTSGEDFFEVLYRSSTGTGWGEAGRRTISNAELSTPNYEGLLMVHCNNPTGLVDGIWGGYTVYDLDGAVKELIHVKPTAPPKIDFNFGVLDTTASGPIQITTYVQGLPPQIKIVDPPIAVNATTFARGVFVAAGGADNEGKIAVSGDMGDTWFLAGTSPYEVLTVCGGP